MSHPPTVPSRPWSPVALVILFVVLSYAMTAVVGVLHLLVAIAMTPLHPNSEVTRHAPRAPSVLPAPGKRGDAAPDR